MKDLEQRAQRFAKALVTLDAILDWKVLGRLYCHEGGEGFFPEEQREAIRDAGLAFAADLGECLRPGGTSHYIGASLAELPLLLFESMVLEREVHWTLLEGPEFDQLAAAMGEVGGPLPVAPCPAPRPVDHLWCVSVLSDPDAFPALHDHLYGREGLGGDITVDRAGAALVIAQGLDGVAPPAILSTTDEELPLFQAACATRGWRLEVPEQGRLSGIVGDVVRHAALTG